jgi:hypothetical protein
MGRFFTVVVTFGLGAGLLFVTWRLVRDTEGFLAASRSVVGRIDDTSGSFPLYSFETPDGSTHRFRGNFASAFSPRAGTPVEVVYDPADPSHASLKGFFTLWLPCLFCGGMSLLSIGAGVLALSATPNRRRATEKQAPPARPWSTRPDWAEGRIGSSTHLVARWVVAIVLNSVVGTVGGESGSRRSLWPGWSR